MTREELVAQFYDLLNKADVALQAQASKHSAEAALAAATAEYDDSKKLLDTAKAAFQVVLDLLGAEQGHAVVMSSGAIAAEPKGFPPISAILAAYQAVMAIVAFVKGNPQIIEQAKALLEALKSLFKKDNLV